jgi:hypothetical protein
LAWHFCTEKNSKKLEKVQERALRFVYEDYNSSYEELLHKAKAAFQDWIRLLKCEKLFSVLKWFGRLFHNVPAANLKDLFTVMS